MLFNSTIFFIFAALFYALWPLVNKHQQSRYIFITVMSYIFYGWWNWKFLFLITACGAFNFVLAFPLDKKDCVSRKILLTLMILGNLSVLGIFKYLNFGIENTNQILDWCGVSYAIPLQSIVLPVGISFYTFQAMSYSIDVYRRQIKPTRNVFHFLAYLSMFPQLVAGPIVRAADLLPQLEKKVTITPEQRIEGLRLIIMGFLRKVVIADNLATLVNPAFNSLGGDDVHTGMIYWWMVMLSFAFQIYGDFSGYSDIARGLAKWMGYEFPLNFNHPYLATSFKDFWARWHISLSSWFKDYVYIPLGGNRKGKIRTELNMIATMLVSGLWHGASWNFIIWGGLHGIYLSLDRVTHCSERLLGHYRADGQKYIPDPNNPPSFMHRYVGKGVMILLVFLGAVIAWVFFRATTLPDAFYVLQEMFSFDFAANHRIPAAARNLLLVAMCMEIFILFRCDKLKIWTFKFIPYLEPALLATVAWICIYHRGAGAQFIYFQF